MRKKAFKRLLVVSLLVMILSSCGQRTFNNNKNEQAKPTITGHAMLAEETLEGVIASEQNFSIVYGTIKEKSSEVGEYLTRSDNEYGWLYRRVVVEVIECYRGGLEPGDTITYDEFGGENERYRFIMEDFPLFEIGDEVLIFIQPEQVGQTTRFVSPYRLFSVDNGIVSVPSNMLSADVKKHTNNIGITELSLESYVEQFNLPDAELTPVEPEVQVQ